MSWFRMYVETMDDPKVMQLDPKVFRAWVVCLCLAKEGNAGYGVIPPASVVAFKLHVSESAARKWLEELTERGLIDVSESGATPHNWNGRQYVSDVSTSRVQRFRNKQIAVSGNANETFQKRPQSTEYRVQSTETPFPHLAAKGQTELAAPDLTDLFDALWSAYPAKGRTKKIACQQYFCGLVGHLAGGAVDAMAERMMAPLRPGGKWKESEKWAKGYVQGLDTYLAQCQWDEEPERAGSGDVYRKPPDPLGPIEHGPVVLPKEAPPRPPKEYSEPDPVLWGSLK
jgi:hypothetical protein